MAATKKRAARAAPAVAEAPPNALEALAIRLRQQVAELQAKNGALAAELTAAQAGPVEDAQPFVARTYPVGGFSIKITGPQKNERDIWIEQVGDTVLILTGRSARARHDGDIGPAALSRPTFISADRPAQAGQSWTNLGSDANPLGLGPSPQIDPEQQAAMLASGNLGAIGGTLDMLASSQPGAGVI